MARKIIDTGTAGNDGTGDSIRESFRKVNDNFRELYSSLGLGERLTFIGLDDTPLTYTGFENSIVSVNNTTDGVVFKQLDSGIGVSIDYSSDPNKIILNAEFAAVSGDPNPKLGGNLSGIYGGQQYRIQDLTTPITDDEAVNKEYADRKVALGGVDAINPETGEPDVGFGTMTGPLILSRDPVPADDVTYNGLIAATKNYVDSSSFGSSVNLYVATSGADERPNLRPELQGRALAYAYRSIEAALKRAEEIMLDSRQELGPYKKILTYDNGTKNVTLAGIASAPGGGAGFAGTVKMTVDTIELADGFPGVNFREGDILRIDGGVFEQACEIRVLTTATNPGRIVAFEILSGGVYTVLPGSSEVTSTATNSVIASNARFNITYKVNNVIVDAGGSGYGLVSVRITPSNGIGNGAFGRAIVTAGEITSLTITDQGSGMTAVPNLAVDLPRFLLKTEGFRTDFTGDVLTDTDAAKRTRDVREGLFVRGETSGALAQILAHEGALDSDGNEIMDVDIKYGSFIEDEVLSYGDVALEKHISILIESGIYEENFPLRIPTNVAIIGNEFRRVIVRPKNGRSSSPWAFLRFKRDLDIDGNETASQQFGYHYLTDSTQPVYPIQNNKGDYTAAAQLLVLNKTFIQNEVVAWINDQIANSIEPYAIDFTYNEDLCKRDVGLIIDAIVFDLKYGGANRTISSALKYFDNASGLIAITDQLSETVAALRRAKVLAQLVIKNEEITELYSDGGFSQIIDLAYVAEPGTFGVEDLIANIELGGDFVEITTTALHGLADFDNIVITDIVGTEELNGNDYFIRAVSSTRIQLYNSREDVVADVADILGGGGPTRAIQVEGYSDYVSGGTITNTGGVVGNLFEVIVDVVEGSGSLNNPKFNNDMDVFLCNDAVIIRAVTGQGHGGFMMVLDPEGQILAKSPYCQESASFSRSTGRKTFAGGLFVDGFAGNLQFKITSDLDALATPGIRLAVSNLDRLPQLPASFIVDDTVYRINYVRNFVFSPSGSTAEFVLDDATPYLGPLGSRPVTISTGTPGTFIAPSNHDLQIGAVLQFSSTGTLPTGLTAGVDYYIVSNGFSDTQFRVSATPGGDPVDLSGGSGTASYVRVFEVLMPGNRSMLSNDFTQVNDLGYGLIATNGGLTEAVSMFTYYNQISYYAIKGGQIRSLGGSSAHGNFALVAEDSDPLEVPTPVSIYHELNQAGTVVADTAATENQAEGVVIFVQYDDYVPLPGSEIEIDHSGVLTTYSISTVQVLDSAQKLVRMNISSSGGLQEAVPHGRRISIRQNSYVVLTGDVVDVTTRPSTALLINDSPFVYRILDFSDYDFNYDYDDFTGTTISIASEAVITTPIPHRQAAGYQVEFETDGDLPDPIAEDVIYYVLEDGLTDYSFKISTTKAGAPVDTSAATQSGVHEMKPYGLALTQLRSNYDYIEMNIADAQPYVTPGSLTAATVTPGTPATVNATLHGFDIGDMIRFSASTYPDGISNQYYWVASDSYVSNSFRISATAPIDNTRIGNSGVLTTTTITGLTSTAGIRTGMKLIAKAAISSVNASGDGTTVTLSFPTQRLRPFLPGQTVTVAGLGSFNGDFEVVTCDYDSLTYADTTTGSATGGTVIPTTTGGWATATVASVPSKTSLIITGSGLSDGTVIFDVEGESVSATTSGSGLEFGQVIGEQGSTSIAISDLSTGDLSRIRNGIDGGDPYVFSYDGDVYSVTNIQTSTELGGSGYSLVTVSPAFETSAVYFNDPTTLKAGIPVPSIYGTGTLTIRIALTRATSHDFLEIGTGSYADTNYPSEIYGPPVNGFAEVPIFSTDTDEEGNRVDRSQVQERNSGRVFFVSTDQYGNFSVGPFFKVDQGTGSVTFSAALALSQLDGLGFKRGAVIAEFSVDDTMADAAVDAVPTESAVRGYIDKRLGITHTGNVVIPGARIPVAGGFMPISGQLAMSGDMDLGNNNIQNVADPVLGQDAVNLRSLVLSNFADINISDPNGADIPIFTGVGDEITNAEVVGDIALELDSTAFTVSAQIRPEVIENADVSPTADIAQSKLDLTLASTRASAPTGSDAVKQAASGVASFDNTNFTITDGFVSIKNNGVALTDIAQIGADSVLGNSTATTANVTAVTFSDVVDQGLALKKSNFTSTGFIRRKNVSSFTGDTGSGIGDSYEIVEQSSTNVVSTLVKRDSNGDFAGRVISASQLKIDNILFADTSATVGSAGVTTLYGYNGQAAINLSDGTLSTDKRNYYDNEGHIFRPQNGIGNAPITCSAVTATGLSTGGAAVAGTVTGQWTLTSGSRFEATYADLAEYYEGDSDYEVGTVLVFGGEKEVTLTDVESDSRVAGVVSENSAYSMNAGCAGSKNLIALQGRVPCKVIGKIKKGDLLVTSEIPGVAKATSSANAGTIIGKALETYDSDTVGTIEVAIGRT